ncbi:MAG: hypothetical protein V1705_02760 [bacterium]
MFNQTLTGFAYLSASLVLNVLVYRFYQYWQKDRTFISKTFLFFAAVMNLFLFVTAIGGLFFAQNIHVLRSIVISVTILQSLASAVLAYFLTRFKFSSFFSWIGFSLIFMAGLVDAALISSSSFRPFLEAGGSINWDLKPFDNTFRSIIFITTILPAGIILLWQSRKAKTSEEKNKAIGFGGVLLMGVFAGIVEFILQSFFNLGAVSTDISVFGLAFSILILIIFTRRIPSKEVKKISDEQ